MGLIRIEEENFLKRYIKMPLIWQMENPWLHKYKQNQKKTSQFSFLEASV